MYVCLGLLVEDKKKDEKIVIHKVRRFLYSLGYDFVTNPAGYSKIL